MARFVMAFIFLVAALELLATPTEGGTTTTGEVVHRNKRFFWPFFGGGRQCGGPGDCPPHHCRLDEAVIYGYCCGCARFTDRVPIHCPPLHCPPSPQPLCSDYDYMMDCCC